MSQVVVTAVGVFVTAVVGVFAILGYTRTWAHREIWYSISQPAAVRTAAGRFPGRQNVYLLRIILENRSRQAITPKMFARKAPIVVNLHVPVLEVVAVESEPAEAQPPDLPVANGTTVRVRPLLLNRGHVVKVSVMTEGRPPRIDVKAQMPDVRLRRRPWLFAR